MFPALFYCARMKKLLSIIILVFSTHAVAETLDLGLNNYSSFAADPVENSRIAQTNFRRLALDLAGAVAMPLAASAAPLGWETSDIGVSFAAVDITQGDKHWMMSATGYNRQPVCIVSGRIIAQKGLPAGFDAGLSLGSLPQLKGGKGLLVGGEVRYAILRGSAMSPAIGVRVHYTRLLGAEEMDLGAEGLEVYISRSFVGMIPYAGIGALGVQSSSKAAGFKPKTEDMLIEPRGVVGLSIFHWKIIRTVAEVSATKPVSVIIPSYSMKAVMEVQ
jgi:hypothetical protein